MTTDLAFDDVEPIPDAPALLHRETAQSYLGRLTAHYGYRTVIEFCRDFGLNSLGIQSGKEAAMRHLARLTGADEIALVRWTPIRVSNGLYRLGDVKFTAELGPRAMVKQCPVCAREAMSANLDLSPDLCLHTRAEWIVDYVATCDMHNVRLVTRRSKRAGIERVDPSSLQASIYEDLNYIDVEHAKPTGFEQYALSLLRGEETPQLPFVNDLNSIDLPKICCFFGADIAKHKGLANPDDRELRDLGFAALVSGSASLRDLLAEMRGNLPEGTMARIMAHNLVRYLDRTHRPELAALKQQIFDLALGDASGITGRLLASIGPDERATGTFVSARDEHQVPWPLLLALAKRIPSLEPRLSEDRTDILVDRAVADELFLGRTPLVTGPELMRVLCHPAYEASRLPRALIDACVISGPIVDRRLLGLRPLFSLPQVEREIAGFLSAFRRVERAPPGLVTLHKAALRSKILLVGLLTMLARRQLSNVVVVQGKPLIESIHVDLPEIFEALFGVSDPVILYDFAKVLGIGPVAGIALIDNGHLKPLRPGIDGIETNLERCISNAELDRFRSRFMRVGEACRATGARSARHLSKHGLEPAISIKLERQRYGRVCFYERSEVQRLRRRIQG